MSKVTSFILGTIVGAAASLVATSLLAPDTVEELTNSIKSKSSDLKDMVEDKVSDSETIDNLKTKFDNSTDLIKSSLQSLPKQTINDDSELTDFDDIVIDDTEAFGDDKSAEQALNDLKDNDDDDNQAFGE